MFRYCLLLVLLDIRKANMFLIARIHLIHTTSDMQIIAEIIRSNEYLGSPDLNKKRDLNQHHFHGFFGRVWLCLPMSPWAVVTKIF
jgi:hypothetical protein